MPLSTRIREDHMQRIIQTLLFIALSTAAASLSQAATIRVGTSYSDVYTRWSEYNGAYQRNYYEEEWLMVGAFIDQRFSLGTNNQGLFVAWNAELWPGLSYENWRDDGGFAFGVRPGFSLGYEGSLEDLHISTALNGGLTWTFGSGDDGNNAPYRELFSTSIAAANIEIGVEWKLRALPVKAVGLGYRIGLFGVAWTDNWINNDPDNEDWFDQSFRAFVRL